ncbi:HoxN/HupN/NixA family nickel/cobalt transporter [Calidifontibacter sp. DB0510]|uniref:Nickel/cobalt efflux system n=1 Tax=Metallococcus carri TaxID=1656884 RepID=A0A967B269_9MICO|nr:HoxN/HupN/NixA family nickel/cobalt transporter [Metallococcus carri]NHN54267.1 HoxN/HupN/NixA family nickel/cobalt transporter [Metallococcus carri]NOP36893.1 HoxN/HupN/NixA family nickel/cobalt transporter [Calidifontibacter sp. DB2511S]
MASATSVGEPSVGWHRRVASAFTPDERRSVIGMTLFVIALHVIGWGTLIAIVAPQQLKLGADGTGHTQVFGIGLGITAYTLGMRHAFDADHIAAIDNTTRKLLNDGRRPVSVGFWFSLGHSSVVFALCLLLAAGIRALAASVKDGGSRLHEITGIIGTTVSGVFLLIIAALNLVALVGIIKVWRRARGGELDEAALEQHLNNRGFFNRFLGGLTKSVRKPWHMYPIGFLFGLGFDTATEVSLLVLAGGAAAFQLPWYAILTLPVLFAAGMSLLDAADGIFMAKAYSWAFARPVRRLYYNATVTWLSVFVALVIGSIEVCSVLAERLDLRSGPVAAIGGINLDGVGFVIVGVFAVTWLLAVLGWKLLRLDERPIGAR